MTGDSRVGNAVLSSDGSFQRRTELRALLLAAADNARRGRGAPRADSHKLSGTIRERVSLLLRGDDTAVDIGDLNIEDVGGTERAVEF